MTGSVGEETMIGAASFEERSLVCVTKFLQSGGQPDAVFLANVVESGPGYERQLAKLRKLGLRSMVELDRLSSRSLWSWCVSTVEKAGGMAASLVIDITCMPRELLGMLLFAVTVRQERFEEIRIVYVSAPTNGYATQNPTLAKDDRWLSKGVIAVRTIVGYPGAFRGERPSHLVVLAGHEFDRLFAIAEYLEPTRLTIGAETESSSTVAGAGVLSREVAEKLRDRIQVPKIGSISFSASSVEGVVTSLGALDFDVSVENVTLVAMNTKLAFVGAAMFSLANRGVRMVYAVPREYNPFYCIGVGTEYCFDITDMLKNAAM